ncbi:Mu transposase C-terminal domain-containing protein [Leptolyngbya sp. AN02str]|uniref:Mu transposase C-terminal domain-containing protein n=1 Tax=Leptolyngbya sp. AN02str TaxID=3423363 RepID=UPI003D31785E
MLTLTELHELLWEWIDNHYNQQTHIFGKPQQSVDIHSPEFSSAHQSALPDVVEPFLAPSISYRVIAAQGVKINYLYYWHPIFRDLELQGQQVEVRFNPENLADAWVYVQGQWLRCFSKYHSSFAGLSEIQVQELSIRIREQHCQSIKKSRQNLSVFQETLIENEASRSLPARQNNHNNIENQ